MARFERGEQFLELWLEQVDGALVTLSREGYIGGGLEGSSPDREVYDYWRELQGRVRGGWKRVREPARDAEDREPRAPELDAALASGDGEVALVYADWLQQRGHPRGELITIQHALRARPDDAELLAAEARLLDSHAEALLGPLAVAIAAQRLALRWDTGFISGATVGGRFDRGVHEEVVWELVRHPSARYLRDLELACEPDSHLGNLVSTLLLVSSEPRPPLRRLAIGDRGADFGRHYMLGDLRGLSPAFPLIEELILKGSGNLIGPWSQPRARKVALRMQPMSLHSLATLTAATWPALVELELWFGQTYQPILRSNLAALGDREHFPLLRSLRLVALQDYEAHRAGLAAIAPWLEIAAP